MSAAARPYLAYLQSCLESHYDSKFYLDQLTAFIELPGRLSREGQPLPIREGDITCLEFDPTRPRSGPVRVRVSDPRFGCRIVCLSGFPSPEAIGYLGDMYRPRPELFLGHLAYERTMLDDRASFELPALPSRRDNIIHIRFIRLCRSRVRRLADFETMSSERKAADEDTQSHERELFRGRHPGATRFRKVNLHSSLYFSVEQLVSFSVAHIEAGRWTAIYLLDRGGHVETRLGVPWRRYVADESQYPDVLHVVDYNDLDEDSFLPGLDGLRQVIGGYILHPHDPLTACFRKQNQDLLGKYPFAICARSLAVAAASWNQMLNHLEVDIDNCHRVEPNNLSGGLAQIQYNISLIKDFQGAISDNRHAIRDRGGRAWPWPDKSTDEAARMDKIKDDLLRDHEELNRRCLGLLRRCEATSTLLQGRIAIHEARRSVEQAALVTRFTRLAFVFIPLSFVAAVFGMNVAEIQANFPPIWTFFLVATVVLIISMIFAITTEQRGLLLDQIEALALQADLRRRLA